MVFLAHPVFATDGINRQIPYHGVLKTADGVNVSDGNYDMVFRMYDVSGSALWTGRYDVENGNPVEVKGGSFEAMLGSGNGNRIGIDFTQDEYYIGITVGTDDEMTPRQRLGSAPYAFNADAVDGTNIFKVSENPEGLQDGIVGDVAIDTSNDGLYIKTSDPGFSDGWKKVSTAWTDSKDGISYSDGSVGIGSLDSGYLLNIATPEASLLDPLHVSAAGLEGITVDSSGLVGIGTTGPSSKLSVAGGAAFGSFFAESGTIADGDVAIENSLSIGTLATGAKLHLSAGTASSGTAPLKIDAGTLLDTVEPGAIEFDGASLYYTDDSATRRTLMVDGILFDTPITSERMTYQHPRDPDEITGNASYSSNFTTYGMYERMDSDTPVSAIQANVWCTNTSRDVTFKIFQRDTTVSFNPDSVTPLYSGTIDHSSMPHASTTGGFLFRLSDPVNVSAGKYLFVIWESTTAQEIRIAYFGTDASSAPQRHSFIIGSLNANFYYTSTSVNYYGASFRVFGDIDITRTATTSLAESLSNGDFETAGSGGSDFWANWIENAVGGGTIVNEMTLVHSGSHAVKLTSSGVNWYTPQILYQLSVSPGQEYSLSFWTRGDGSHAGKYAISATGYGYLNGSNGGLTTGVAGNVYTQVTTSFTVPEGCSQISLFFIPDNTSAGNVAYFDDISAMRSVTTETLRPLSIETVLNNLPSAAITFSDPNGIMTSTNVRDAIIEAYNHSSGESSLAVSPRIVLPDDLYAVVGDKLQLFVRGMIEAQNPYNLPYAMDSTVGNSYPRYFEYTPVAADVGTKSFTAKVLNYDYSVLSSKTVNLKVSNPTGQPSSNKNILCLGDSLTAGGVWPAELYRRLTQTGGSPAGLGYGNITFIGDQSLPGYPSQAYTGYGGWSYHLYNGVSGTTYGHVLTGSFDKDKTDVNSTWQDSNGATWNIEYATGGLKIHGSGTLPPSGTLTHVSGGTHASDIVYTGATTEPESPFWDSANNRLSFSNWASRNGYSSIDVVYVLLGWNSTGGANVTDYSSYMAQVRTFLNQLHTDFPNTIVRIVGIQVPSVNGGLGANYGANGGLSEYYGMVRSANSMNMAYQDLTNEAAYSSWVEFVSTAPQFDSENNMPQSLSAVNSRNTATEYRGTNGVHPATAGYYQIADAVFREFVYTFDSH